MTKRMKRVLSVLIAVCTLIVLSFIVYTHVSKQKEMLSLPVTVEPEEIPPYLTVNDFVVETGPKYQDLVERVDNFLLDKPYASVSFVYKKIDEPAIYYHAYEPIIAGSTYKLPVNMLVNDKIRANELSSTENLVMCWNCAEKPEEEYEFMSRYPNGVSIADLSEKSIVYSDNVASHILVERMGGFDKVYQDIAKYGRAEGLIPTINVLGNETSAAYLYNVVAYLYEHRQDYTELLAHLHVAEPRYYGRLLTDVDMYHKSGDFSDAINDVVIVNDKQPYMIVLLSENLGFQDYFALAQLIHTYHVEHTETEKKRVSTF